MSRTPDDATARRPRHQLELIQDTLDADLGVQGAGAGPEVRRQTAAEGVIRHRAGRHGVDTRGLWEDLASLGLAFEPFSAGQAETAGQIKERTRRLGLSLGDRACLALGSDRGEAVYTSDRAWLQLTLGVDVEAIR